MAYGVQPQLTGSNTLGHGREFTAEVWDGYDPAAMDRDPSIGFYDADDFMNGPVFPANSALAGASGKYRALTSNTALNVIEPLAGQGGILKLSLSATDNNECYLQASRSHILATADEDDAFPYHHVARVRLGVRFALGTVTDNQAGMFIGLIGQDVATGALAANTAALVSTFHGIGLNILQADGNAMNLVYQESGTALQTVLASALVPVINTWYTFEMDYNPFGKTDEFISFWINGTKLSTFVTKAQFTATATLGPVSTDSVTIPVGFGALRVNGEATASHAYLGGYRCWSELGKARGNEVCG